MLKTPCLFALFFGLLLAVFGASALPANKCVVNGKVTYQQAPCSSGEARKQPTVEALNAQEKKKRAAAAATSPDKVAPAAPQPPAVAASPTAAPAPAIFSSPKVSSAFRCDARKHCTQMTSCAEAKFFLANCPGVKMDGDRDGIPCEEQLCGH